MSLGLTVLGTASPHPQPGRPCSGYLLRGGGAEVWVDAGPGLAVGADLFLCEADIDRHRGSERQVHLTPEDAGAVAEQAGVGELLVTHVGPTLTPESATERAAAVFGGRTTTAREGDTTAL